MKKLLSILLVLCMLCTVMVSCAEGEFDGLGTTDNSGATDGTTAPDDGNTTTSPDGDSGNTPDDALTADDLKNDSLTVITDSYNKALIPFFDAANVIATLSGMEKGAAHITVENAMLTEESGIGKITESLYFDFTDGAFNKIVSDTDVVIGEETLGATIFVEKENLAMLGEALFSTENAYKLGLVGLVDAFTKSELKAILDEEDAESVEDFMLALQTIEDVWKKVSAPIDEAMIAEYKAWAENVLAAFNPVVKEETLNGKSVLTITYTMTNETIEAYLEAALTQLPESFYDMMLMVNSMNGMTITKEEMKAMLDEGYAEMIEEFRSIEMNISLLCSYSIVKDTGALAQMSLVGTIDQTADEDAVVVNPNVTLTFAENAIVLNAKIDYTENEVTETANMVFTLTREEKDGVVTFKGDLDAFGTDSENNEIKQDDIIVLLTTYNKTTGALAMEITLTNEYEISNGEETFVEKEVQTLSFGGTLTVADGKVSFTADSFGASGMSITDIGVKIVIDTKAEIPAIPEDAINVMDMTAEDWMALAEGIENSMLRQLIGSMGGSEDTTMMPIMPGTYIRDGGMGLTLYDDGSFSFGLGAIISMEGYYYINPNDEGDGLMLTLAFSDENKGGEWVEQTMSLEIMGDVLIIDDVKYYYDYGSNNEENNPENNESNTEGTEKDESGFDPVTGGDAA